MRTKITILVALIAGLHLALLFAGFFAPYDPTTQNRDLPYAPPTRLHFKDSSGFHLRPLYMPGRVCWIAISLIVIKKAIKKIAATSIPSASL